MRARRSAFEPAGEGFHLARVVQRRDGRSRNGGRTRLGTAASLLLHGGVLALLLLVVHGRKIGEEQESAPAFAIQFDSGAAQQTPPTTAPSQPRVSVDESDDMPPPQPDVSPDAALPPPPLHYGRALRPRVNNNPFAKLVPFDLSPAQTRSASSARPGLHGLNLAVGPVIQNGRITESVTHVRGAHGNEDYAEEIRAFVETHKYYPQQAAQNGEEGAATLTVTIRRDGSIKHLQWVSRSGSALLDAAWFSVFHDNRLPPMNDDMPGDEYTFVYTLDYHLIYASAR